VAGCLFVAKTQSGSADEPLNIPYNSMRECNELRDLFGRSFCGGDSHPVVLGIRLMTLTFDH
jgi:hypothetical protein